jgi:hypothetical protein
VTRASAQADDLEADRAKDHPRVGLLPARLISEF